MLWSEQHNAAVADLWPTSHRLCRNGFALAQLIPVRLLLFLAFLRILLALQAIPRLIHLTLFGGNGVLRRVQGLDRLQRGKFIKSHTLI